MMNPEVRHSSPSKRWVTTAGSAMDETARKFAEAIPVDRLQELRARKIANTKTSIRFGNDPVNYVSDTRENQNKIMLGQSSSERATLQANIKKMKADLTATKFKLGDEVPLYETVNRAAMAASQNCVSTAREPANENHVKEMIKKSSLHFGNEPVKYESIAHEAMEYRGNQANFAALKKEVGDMSANLRKHNFSFGEEKVLYQSDYSRGYGSVPREAYVKTTDKKDKMKAVIEDSRSCHFSLGNDKVNYTSNTHSALNQVNGREAGDVSASIERAAAMKAALQKTSFIVGDDEDYM